MRTQSPARHLHHQHGATIVAFALMVVLLLGFVGIALDFARLYIVKSELQTAMDSCALAGAHELDEKANARDRARKAGVLSANLNGVNLQSANWDGELKTIEADLEVLDATMGAATSDVQARYVRCTHIQGGVSSWILKVMAIDTGDTVTYPSQQSTFASATATRGSVQSTCVFPLGLIVLPTNEEKDYGFKRGQWVVALKYQKGKGNGKDDPDEPDLLVPGEMGWFNLDGSQSAENLIDQLTGEECKTSANAIKVITPGAKLAAADEWNYRFGIYHKKVISSDNPPDMTGFAYTSDRWPRGQSAYQDFLNKRKTYTPYPGKFANKYKEAATSSEHRAYGNSGRIVMVPVLSFMGGRNYQVVNFACMLLLGPMKIYEEDVYMEFLGIASQPDSPCTSGGKPGGTVGPLVPTLVR